MGGDEHVLAAVGLQHGDEGVPLVQAQGPDAAGPDVLQGRHRQALHRAPAGDHEQIQLLLGKVPEVDHGLDPLPRLHLEDVHDVGALGGLAALGDLIALLAIDLARVGEEEQIVVGGGGEHVHHIVLLPGGDALAALAALGLGGILADGGALDIARLGQGEHALLLLDQVLDVQFVLHVLDLGDPVIAILVPDGDELVLQNAPEHGLVGQQALEIGDALLQLVILALELLPVQTLKGLQAHVQDGLGLHVVQAEAVHQALLGVIIGGADDVDDLVDVVLGHQQTLQQVGPLLGLAQVIFGAADDDLLLIGDILVQNVPQGQDAGLELAVHLHQGQHIDGEGGLKLGLGEQAVEHHLGVSVTLELDDDAHAVPVRLVPDVGDALQPLVLHLVGHVLDELALVHLIGDLGDDDAGAVLAELLKLVPGADHQAATAGGIGGPDAAAAHDDPLSGEVGALHVLHQVGQGTLRVVQHTDGGIDDLPQVVGGDVGGHAHGDAGRAVYQQVGEAGGQHPGLLAALVKVGVPVHRVLFDVPEHLVGDLAQPGLGVTIGGRGVAIHGAEVAVAVHQHVAHGEVLGQTDQGVVHRRVAVGVIPAQHVAHAGGRLLKGLVRGQVVLVHGVKNAPVDGLQAVPHVRQGPAHDDGHGIFDIGFLHLRDQRRGDDLLLGIPDLLGVVLGFFRHLWLSPYSRR